MLFPFYLKMQFSANIVSDDIIELIWIGAKLIINSLVL